jgi:hypothetical protein
MEHEFGVASGDNHMLYQLMEKDLFLFPTAQRVSTHSYCLIRDLLNWACRSLATPSVLERSAPRSKSYCSSRQNQSVWRL